MHINNFKLLEWTSVNIPNDKPNFICLIGSPGSGKSTIAGEIIRNFSNIKIYNIDKWLELKTKQQGIDFKDTEKIKTLYSSPEAQNLIKKSKDSFYKNINTNDDILIDLTGRSALNILDYHMSNIQYDCNKILVYVITPLEQCINRVKNRIRGVELDYLVKTYFQIQTEYVKYFHNFDYIWIVINDNDRLVTKFTEFKTKYKDIANNRTLCLKSPDDTSDVKNNAHFYQQWGNMSGDMYKYIIELIHKINKNYSQTLIKSIYNQIDDLNTEYSDHQNINGFINYILSTKSSLALEVKSLEEFTILNYLKNYIIK